MRYYILFFVTQQVNMLLQHTEKRLMHKNKQKVLFTLLGVIVVFTTTGCDLFAQPDGQQQTPTVITNPTNNVIKQENALQGTASWQIPDGHGASIQIQAYASATSVNPGQSLTFSISTEKEGTPYSVNIYRLGWYNSLGARLMTTLPNQPGFAQGYYDRDKHRLVDC